MPSAFFASAATANRESFLVCLVLGEKVEKEPMEAGTVEVSNRMFQRRTSKQRMFQVGVETEV